MLGITVSKLLLADGYHCLNKFDEKQTFYQKSFIQIKSIFQPNESDAKP